jgi:hypothetical protein
MSKPSPDEAVREHASAIRQYLESGYAAAHADGLREELIEILKTYQPDPDITWNALWLGDKEVFQLLLDAQGIEAFDIDNNFGGPNFWSNWYNIPAGSGIRGPATDLFLKANETAAGFDQLGDLCKAFLTDDPAVIQAMLDYHNYPTSMFERLVQTDAFFIKCEKTAHQRIRVLRELQSEETDVPYKVDHRAFMILAKMGFPPSEPPLRDSDNPLNRFISLIQSNHARLRVQDLLRSAEELFSMPNAEARLEMERISSELES